MTRGGQTTGQGGKGAPCLYEYEPPRETATPGSPGPLARTGPLLLHLPSPVKPASPAGGTRRGRERALPTGSPAGGERGHRHGGGAVTPSSPKARDMPVHEDADGILDIPDTPTPLHWRSSHLLVAGGGRRPTTSTPPRATASGRIPPPGVGSPLQLGELTSHIVKLERTNATLKAQLRQRMAQHQLEVSGYARQLERKGSEIELLHAELHAAGCSAATRTGQELPGSPSPGAIWRDGGAGRRCGTAAADEHLQLAEADARIVELEEKLSHSTAACHKEHGEKRTTECLLGEREAQLLELHHYANRMLEERATLESTVAQHAATIAGLRQQLEELELVGASRLAACPPSPEGSTRGPALSPWDLSLTPRTMSLGADQEHAGASPHAASELGKARDREQPSQGMQALPEAEEARALALLWEAAGILRRRHHPRHLLPRLLAWMGLVGMAGLESPVSRVSGVRLLLTRLAAVLLRCNQASPWLGVALGLMLLLPMLVVQRVLLWLLSPVLPFALRRPVRRAAPTVRSASPMPGRGA